MPLIGLLQIMNLPHTDLAVTSQAATKELPKGWAIVPTTSTSLIATAQTNFLAFPITSVLMCTWLLTRESPAWKPLGDAMLIVMLCLAPIVGIRTIRATDIRMKHVFWIGLAGIVSHLGETTYDRAEAAFPYRASSSSRWSPLPSSPLQQVPTPRLRRQVKQRMTDLSYGCSRGRPPWRSTIYACSSGLGKSLAWYIIP